MALGEAFHQRAVRRLSQRLSEAEKAALLVFDPANIAYLTGLTIAHSERPIAACLWADGRIALFVPQMEADHLASGWVRDIRWYAEYPADESPVRWMAREAGDPLVVDAVAAEHWLEIVAEVEDATLDDMVAELRAVKTEAEIELIALAAEFADLALERTFARLTSGSSEQDVLADILSMVDGIMRQELGDRYVGPVPAITGTLQSGMRAALPAAPTSGKRLARGDNVIVEFTARVGGYYAQAGCTFFVGDPLRDVVRWVEASMLAQAAALEAMTPGATAASVDLAARKTLERFGLAVNVRHRTGHGIGLSRWEQPWLIRADNTVLQPGMVLVNRPGIYVPGRTGARNSQTVVIEAEGARVLNPRLERWADLESRLKEF